MLEKILSLSLEQKIGQLFFIGISGTEMNDEMRHLIREISPGGVCFFARNIRNYKQVHGLIREIDEELPITPFISIDQEGGAVDRLRKISTPMPAAGTLKTLEQVTKLAQLTAQILRILNFNMNFAPVTDIPDTDKHQFNNGLYSRTFSGDANNIVKFAKTYLQTLQENDCFGCLKHFPGLGASKVDSHEDLPVVNLTREELFGNDLLPYLKLFQTGEVHSVMTAHACFPNFDLQEADSNGKLLPSSLSYNISTRLLREELGFKGLSITDDLEMGAILKNYGIGEACIMAVNAGQNMLAICANPESIRIGYHAVLKAARNGQISESKIEESLFNIAHLKSMIKPPPPFDEDRLEFLSKEIADLNNQLI